MALLAYCMMEAATMVEKPAAGVGGRKIDELADSGLRCFFSRFENREQLSGTPAVESAVAFHQVLQALFQQAVIVPFRFPTVVDGEEELRQHVEAHASRYAEALSRLRHMVQMEIHIGQKEEGTANLPASGHEYLQGRQALASELKTAAKQFRQTTGPWVAEWRERQTKQGMRCYALLSREAVAGFQNAARTLRQSLPGARVSGPWPPAEFLEIKAS